jgi:hypothetical protein
MDDRGDEWRVQGPTAPKLATWGSSATSPIAPRGRLSRTLGWPAPTRPFSSPSEGRVGDDAAVSSAPRRVPAATKRAAARMPRVRRSASRRWAAGCRRRWPAVPDPSRRARTRAGTPSVRSRARTRPRPKRSRALASPATGVEAGVLADANAPRGRDPHCMSKGTPSLSSALHDIHVNVVRRRRRRSAWPSYGRATG